MEGTLDFSPPVGRQRVTQACIACRRRKTRCNGQQPCESCRVAGLECTYGPQKRLNAYQYASSLERKIQQLERLLQCRPSNVSRFSDESQSEEFDAQYASSSQGSQQATVVDLRETSGQDLLETMVDAPGRVSSPADRTDSESEDYGFGGLSLLQRLNNLCRDATGREPQGDGRRESIPNAPHESNLSSAFDIVPLGTTPPIPWNAFAMLPSERRIHKAIDIVLDVACCNMQFFDSNYLHEFADEALRVIERGQVEERRKDLSLLFAILALSQRFDETNDTSSDDQTLVACRYFRASVALLDPSNCQDLTSLRTLLCIVIFTQGSSMLSACYSYVCMAVAAGLQMGLFTDKNSTLPLKERATAKTIAVVLFVMDTYVTTALGLPRTLRDVDFGHVVPDFATQPDHSKNPFDETQMHARLARILGELIESNHPILRSKPQRNGVYGVENWKILRAEDQLNNWLEQLTRLTAASDGPEEGYFLRSQLMLRLYYAFVQIVLYRPFLHHALSEPAVNDPLAAKGFACGSTCIKASMTVVWLVERMEQSNIFCSNHWFLTLVIANAAACLVLFVIGAEGAPTREETKDAVRRLREICARHCHRSPSLEQCLLFVEGFVPGDTATNEEAPAGIHEKFQRNIFSFNNASRGLPNLDQMETEEDNLEALSLPHFQDFVHTSF